MSDTVTLDHAVAAASDFFASLSAADVLSSVAGLGGLVVSLVALHQARQSNLRPSIESRSQWHEPLTFTDEYGEPFDVEEVEVIITNSGAGDAVDVRVSFTDESQERSLGTLTRDARSSVRFNAALFDGSAPFDYTVTWREYPPKNGKLRKKKGQATVSDPTILRNRY